MLAAFAQWIDFKVAPPGLIWAQRAFLFVCLFIRRQKWAGVRWSVADFSRQHAGISATQTRQKPRQSGSYSKYREIFFISFAEREGATLRATCEKAERKVVITKLLCYFLSPLVAKETRMQINPASFVLRWCISIEISETQKCVRRGRSRNQFSLSFTAIDFFNVFGQNSQL